MRHFTREQISKLFRYNPDTGQLWRFWLRRGEWREIKTTHIANGRTTTQMVSIEKPYSAQATWIMFMLMTGRWPAIGLEIDHRDQDPENMRWSNLREGTKRQNMWNNAPDLARLEYGEAVGVIPYNGKFAVRLQEGGKRRYFGLYPTVVEANAVARVQRLRIQGAFAGPDPNAPDTPENYDVPMAEIISGRKGENVPTSVLKEYQVRAIRRLAEEYTQQAIADAFGVGPGTVGDIICRRTWAHVEDEPEARCRLYEPQEWRVTSWRVGD